MNKVLETTKTVVDNSIFIEIDHHAIRTFYENINQNIDNHWLESAPININDLEDNAYNFALVLNSISFCLWETPRWQVKYEKRVYDGTWALIAMIANAVKEGIPILDFNYLKDLKSSDLSTITSTNIQIPHFEKRLHNLRELGYIMEKRFLSNPRNLIEEAKADAKLLLDLIVNLFPNYRDESNYQRRKIYFYKRAQLLTSDLLNLHRFNNNSITNLSYLTACADYKIPQVLRRYKILKYDDQLIQKLLSNEIIDRNSQEEIEIRANTILAVEAIKEHLKYRFPKITSILINDFLWLQGQHKFETDEPYHKTVTTFY